MMNWPVELLEMAALHQRQEEASDGVAKAIPFGAKAPEQALAECERIRGFKLDPEHRRFLQHADGWDRFSADIDLFATADFLGSERFGTAMQWIGWMDRGVLGPYAKLRSSLFPIAKSSASTDLLLMMVKQGQVQPQVLWFANELIEEYDSFEQMFASFKVYARKGVEFWLKRKAGG